MARHSKWHNIRVKKQANDKLRGKVFTIHAKLIALCAQKGADPSKNPALAEAIEKAKKDNVPNDNIERAIKKGSGADKSGDSVQEIIYEGYGAGGIGIVVKALTDNRNRTAPNIRHYFSKYGGNLAESGSLTGFAFRLVGSCMIGGYDTAKESIEELIIESCADDFFEENESTLKVIVEKNRLHELVSFLKDKGLQIEEYGLDYLPNTIFPINEIEKGLKIAKLVEALEEDEDVEMVWSNYEMDEATETEVYRLLEQTYY